MHFDIVVKSVIFQAVRELNAYFSHLTAVFFHLLAAKKSIAQDLFFENYFSVL